MDDSCAPGTAPPKVVPKEDRKGLGFGMGPTALRSFGVALVLDGNVMFPIIDSKDVPCGYVEVDVKVDDNGLEFDSIMLAGHMGGRIIHEGEGEGEEREERLGVASAWVLFVKDPAKEKELEEKQNSRNRRF